MSFKLHSVPAAAPKANRQDHTAAHTLLVNQGLLALGKISDVVLWPNPVKKLKCIAHDGSIFYVRTGLAIGSADIISCVAGRFAGFEAKTGNAQLEPEQRDWHAMVQKKGGFAAVFRSVPGLFEALERCRRGELC